VKGKRKDSKRRERRERIIPPFTLPYTPFSLLSILSLLPPLLPPFTPLSSPYTLSPLAFTLCSPSSPPSFTPSSLLFPLLPLSLFSLSLFLLYSEEEERGVKDREEGKDEEGNERRERMRDREQVVKRGRGE
jgi:hypothetical protein